MTTLTPADVAADLHLSVEAVHRHLRAGTIPTFKVGRAYRIDPDEYAAWKVGSRPVSYTHLTLPTNREV